MRNAAFLGRLVVLSAACYVFAVAWHQIRAARKQKSLWPTTPSNIEVGDISEVVVKDRGRHDHYHWRLKIEFSYLVNGSRFRGFYQEKFPFSEIARFQLNDNPAERSLKKYQEEPFLVHYNPISPAEYYVDPDHDATIS